jgi:hypothetical protein
MTYKDWSAFLIMQFATYRLQGRCTLHSHRPRIAPCNECGEPSATARSEGQAEPEVTEAVDLRQQVPLHLLDARDGFRP